jgi:hypothetical protein
MNRNAFDGVVPAYVIMKYFIGGPSLVTSTLGVLAGSVIFAENLDALQKALK